jgi:hypothetical protein
VEPRLIHSAEPLTVVPEPSTALVLLVGSLALAVRCRAIHVRRRRNTERKNDDLESLDGVWTRDVFASRGAG